MTISHIRREHPIIPSSQQHTAGVGKVAAKFHSFRPIFIAIVSVFIGHVMNNTTKSFILLTLALGLIIKLNLSFLYIFLSELPLLLVSTTTITNTRASAWIQRIPTRLAQFSALVLLKWLQIKYIQPLYLAMTRRSLPTCARYGQWVILTMTEDDFHNSTTLRTDSLSLSYARFLLARKFHIFIIVSISTKRLFPPDIQHLTHLGTNNHEIVSKHLREVLLHAFDPSMQSFVDFCILPFLGEKDIHSERPPCESFTHAVTDRIQIVLESHLGRMTLDGGIGMFILCCSSTLYTTDVSDSVYSSRQAQHVQILRMILQHMIFRKSGAIISVVPWSNVQENNKIPSTRREKSISCPKNEWDSLVQSSLDIGSQAFLMQLIRSLHYEYREYGIDCIAVRNYGKMKNLDLVVKASLHLLGCEPEINIHEYSKFVSFVDGMYSKG